MTITPTDKGLVTTPLMRTARKSLRTLVAAAGLLIAHEATASALDDTGMGFEDDNPFANMDTVSDTDLADMRGGFIAGGLNISFGVDVLSLVNGTPVIQYSFTDANLPSAPVVPAGLQHIVDNNGLQNVIQVGDGNQIINSFGGFDGMLTVIQNTMDNTVIQHFSTITLDISAVNPAIAQMQNLNLSLGF